MYETVLEIESLSYEFQYDGTEHTYHEKRHGPLLSPDHHLEIKFQAARTDVGTTQNYFTCKVFEGEGENAVDVSYKYYFKNTYGSIKVSPVKITLTADTSVISYKDFKKPVEEGGYGGIYEAQEPTLSAEPEVLAMMEALGHKIAKVQLFAEALTARGDESGVEIGEVIIVDSGGRDVTGNYDIERIRGHIKVTTK